MFPILDRLTAEEMKISMDWILKGLVLGWHPGLGQSEVLLHHRASFGSSNTKARSCRGNKLSQATTKQALEPASPKTLVDHFSYWMSFFWPLSLDTASDWVWEYLDLGGIMRLFYIVSMDSISQLLQGYGKLWTQVAVSQSSAPWLSTPLLSICSAMAQILLSIMKKSWTMHK